MTRTPALLLIIALVVIALLLLGSLPNATADAARAAAPNVTLFTDTMESGTNGWTVSHSAAGGATCSANEWAQTTLDSHSATHSWTNTPYTAATTGTCFNDLVSPAIVTPNNASNLALSFWHHFFTEGPPTCNAPSGEPPCDFGIVQISTNNGASWSDVSSRYEGGTAVDPYVQVNHSLEGLYIPGDTIKLRFRFSSDATLAAPPYLGWYIDDVVVTADVSGPTLTSTLTPTNTPTATNTPTGGVQLVFGPSTVVDPQRTEGEPLNWFAQDGTYWESGPYGTSTQLSFIHRSTDGGDQFNVVSAVGLRPDPPPGGGDTDIVTDDQNIVYFVDLEALVNLGCAVSNDSGNNWRKNASCIPQWAVDRQWFAVDNGSTAAATDNTVFLTWRNAALSSFIYSTPGSLGSSDTTGGLVYSNASADPINPVNTGAPCGQMKFDPVKRNLYLPCGDGNTIQVAKGHVNPGQRTGITFTTFNTPASPGGGDTATIFPTLSVDGAGNLYTVWTDSGDHNTYYSYSTNEGSSWSTPTKLNSGAAVNTLMPWTAAGSAGNMVAVWYGTDDPTNGDDMTNWYDDRIGATDYEWFGYAAIVQNANTNSPTITQARFTDKPMNFGQICTGGLGCSVTMGDRTMADYFNVNLDNSGRIRIVYNDTTSQHHGAHLFESRQLNGPNLRGGAAFNDSAPSNPVADPTGDAQSPHFSTSGAGANLPQYDVTQLRLSEPGGNKLRVEMSLNSLASLAPPSGKTNGFWLARFQTLSVGEGGEDSYRIFYVGAESVNGGALSYFAGSGMAASEAGVTGNGCQTNTPENCKIVFYPAEVVASGCTGGNTIVIDVSMSNGFGANRPFNGNKLYSVTAFTGGRLASSDVYADLDSTRAFDYTLGGGSQASPCAPGTLNTPTPTQTATVTPTGTLLAPTSTHTPTITPTHTPVMPVTLNVEDDTTRIQYDGWRGVNDSNASGSSYRVNAQSNARAKFRFTGGNLKWITYRGPDQGIAKVFVDGSLVETVDLYNATPQFQYVVTLNKLGGGNHVVLLKGTGTKNNNSANTNIVLDAFEYGNTRYENEDNRVKLGSWKRKNEAGASGGHTTRGAKPNSAARLEFAGDAIQWVTAKGPAYGHARVFVDGVDKGKFNLYAKNQQWQVAFTFSNLGSGQHAIEIRPLHTKKKKSTGYQVIVDAFRGPISARPDSAADAPPGVAPESSIVGILEGVDENARTVTIRSDEGTHTLSINKKTLLELNGVEIGLRELRAGLFVSADYDPAQNIATSIDADDASGAPEE
jgi:hypothetical protein